MRKVFAAHQNRGLAFRNAESGDLYDCSCARRFSDYYDHLTEALSAAGFGPVADAKAEALEEAADALKPSGAFWWGTSGVTVAEGASGPPTATLDDWLRTRAAAVRGEG